MGSSINAASGPRLQQHWDWRAAGNFIGGGSGAGLLVVCALAGLVQPVEFAAAALGLLLVAGGLGLVWLELGKPWRSLHVFFHPQTSWMSREASLALPLFGLGLAALWLQSVALLWASAACGAGFAYCQGRILRAARGIPAWREPRVVGLMLSTAAVEGVCAYIVLGAFSAGLGGSTALGIAAIALLLVLGLRLQAWHGYRHALRGRAPEASLRALDRWHPVFLGLGHALPAALALAAPLSGERAADLLLALAAGAALAMGWLLKFVLIRRAAYNQGFAIQNTAARGGKAGPGCKPGWKQPADPG